MWLCRIRRRRNHMQKKQADIWRFTLNATPPSPSTDGQIARSQLNWCDRLRQASSRTGLVTRGEKSVRGEKKKYFRRSVKCTLSNSDQFNKHLFLKHEGNVDFEVKLVSQGFSFLPQLGTESVSGLVSPRVWVPHRFIVKCKDVFSFFLKKKKSPLFCFPGVQTAGYAFQIISVCTVEERKDSALIETRTKPN